MRFIGRLVGRVIGLSLLAGIVSAVAAAIAKNRLVSSGEPDDDEIALVTIFDGLEFVSTASAFRGGSALCWYGGVSMDLRGATLDPAGATLDIRTLFGGLRLVVPPEWHVRRELMAVFGGIADTRGDETGETAQASDPDGTRTPGTPGTAGAAAGASGTASDTGADASVGPTLTLTGWAMFGGVAVMSDAPDLDSHFAESGAV